LNFLDEVIAMNETNPAVSFHGVDSAKDRNEFCVCRVIEDCALIKIDSKAKLPAAKKYMRWVASRVPGSYVVFSYRTHRVLGKVISAAAA
jgi:hypothetical protein